MFGSTSSEFGSHRCALPNVESLRRYLSAARAEPAGGSMVARWFDIFYGSCRDALARQRSGAAHGRRHDGRLTRDRLAGGDHGAGTPAPMPRELGPIHENPLAAKAASPITFADPSPEVVQ